MEEEKEIYREPTTSDNFNLVGVYNPSAAGGVSVGSATQGAPDMTQIYEVLAPMAGQYANAQAEQIGQAQQSMGPLAANTMGTTTAGLGNYTYNRLMRPQVDVMRDEILVEGYRNKLNQALSDAYKTAQRNYSRRSGGGRTTGASGSSDNAGSGVTKITGSGAASSGMNPTRWSALPNSYQWQDADGNWHTATRSEVFTDEDWLRIYQGAKRKAEQEGRGFKG